MNVSGFKYLLTRKDNRRYYMNWSLIGNVLLAILFIAVIVLALLYYF